VLASGRSGEPAAISLTNDLWQPTSPLHQPQWVGILNPAPLRPAVQSSANRVAAIGVASELVVLTISRTPAATALKKFNVPSFPRAAETLNVEW
jgi:hypothetical protein